jgi:ribosome-associated translation inhibitor RaiA
VQIVFHAHNADMSDSLQERAEQAVRKLASRLRRAVDASVRFTEDGPVRRVEIVLRAPRRRPLVAVGSGRLYESALGQAVAHLESHLAHLKAVRSRPIRAARATTRVPGVAAPLAADGDVTGASASRREAATA